MKDQEKQKTTVLATRHLTSIEKEGGWCAAENINLPKDRKPEDKEVIGKCQPRQ